MPKGKTGPKGPTKPMDNKTFKQLVAMIEIQCTEEEICSVLGMSDTTLNRRIKERKIEGVNNFEDLYKKHSGIGRESLRRMQWASAKEGSIPMQIWLGKQMLGQRDKQSHDGGEDGKPIQFEITRRVVDPSNEN